MTWRRAMHARSRRLQAGQGAASRERGETLIELMVAVILMGMSIVILVQAIFTLVGSTDRLNRQTSAAVAAVEVVESLKDSLGDLKYVPCAKPTGSLVYTGFVPASLPPHWAAQITEIAHMRSDQFGTWLTGTCSTNPTTASRDAGVQRITVRVRSTAATDNRPVDETIVFIKRNRDCLSPMFRVTAYDNFDGGPC